MGMKRVFDKEGNMFMKDPVDVRECVDVLGWSTTPPEGFEEPAEEETEDSGTDYDKMDAAGLRGLLDERNIPYRANTGKKKLIAMLDEYDAAQESDGGESDDDADESEEEYED